MTKNVTPVIRSTFTFTTRTLNALTGAMVSDGQKARQFTDDKVNDLKLELTRTGKKTFSFRAQRDGKKQYQCIGSYPAISIDEARKTALELRAQLDRGHDVSADRRRLEPVLNYPIAVKSKPHGKPQILPIRCQRRRMGVRRTVPDPVPPGRRAAQTLTARGVQRRALCGALWLPVAHAAQ